MDGSTLHYRQYGVRRVLRVYVVSDDYLTLDLCFLLFLERAG